MWKQNHFKYEEVLIRLELFTWLPASADWLCFIRTSICDCRNVQNGIKSRDWMTFIYVISQIKTQNPALHLMRAQSLWENTSSTKPQWPWCCGLKRNVETRVGRVDSNEREWGWNWAHDDFKQILYQSKIPPKRCLALSSVWNIHSHFHMGKNWKALWRTVSHRVPVGLVLPVHGVHFAAVITILTLRP